MRQGNFDRMADRQRPRIHLLADRSDLPAQPRRARRLLAAPSTTAISRSRSSRRSGASTSSSPSRSGSTAAVACSTSAAAGGRCSTSSASARRVGVGVTLSSAQAASCRSHGLDARIQDAREVDRDGFGSFDAIASLGAFEHFCSPDDYRAGRQDADLLGSVREHRRDAARAAAASTCRRWSSGAT